MNNYYKRVPMLPSLGYAIRMGDTYPKIISDGFSVDGVRFFPRAAYISANGWRSHIKTQIDKLDDRYWNLLRLLDYNVMEFCYCMIKLDGRDDREEKLEYLISRFEEKYGKS